ncbi:MULTISPECIES: stage III sporulation protein AA [Aneurinibacillus]|uniref:Stage III sporulation protein AA n=1 Tax=Aneurinibacillus thermoaerophilus TaxID=143495 RepID=A0ABX8YFM7_ANETH|nr:MULTISPECIES: stage III sporulation protein AA [Aneurinibacillus]AMA72506.1 stage III sporulation protein AA [Aneurinibacillus sp. XH2]MED0675607.1 stage III sporulation protein AA [Aneurinibacillus thermoaerophilus]MED0681282.1 stage III sporulation protein AA [Aneurinibacillus thermoaerophilus]MED0735508.1 stage III sporulation protein AA [Aneurinibacillus thermoaerophilus]MED0756608.1 stage III sporulation protein AA [Aneurinibacillus thermoaerophilus]
MEEVLRMLPDSLRVKLKNLSWQDIEQMEEIRLRVGRPIEYVGGGASWFISGQGGGTRRAEEALTFTKEEGMQLLSRLSHHSVYMMEEEMRRGYITVQGGHRVGLSGKVVLENGRVKLIRDVTSFNIRFAREKRGVADGVLPLLVEGGQLKNTLVISPPQCGKTTLLRDLARQISYGSKEMAGKKVSIVDERSEIAGCVAGVPQKDVGPRTDVLDACPKAEGMMMMIRSMSPEVLITDEIGRPEDGYALEEAIHAGITVIASVHGRDLKDIMRRPTLSRILQAGVFQRYLVLSRRPKVGTVAGVYNEHFTECRR